MEMERRLPTLSTPRLVLRPFQEGDAPDVQRLASDREIASTTLSIPHPYEEGMAAAWIEKQRGLVSSGELACFAVVVRETEELIGSIGLTFQRAHERAELGYWIGKAYWGCGYATEAALAVIEYGFRVEGLSRIYAHCMTRNPASARVMQKAGMTLEGRLRRHIRKWDVLEDIEHYGILKSEFDSRT